MFFNADLETFAAAPEPTEAFAGAIDNDQFDLNLPATFMEACGTRGLPLKVITND